MNNIAKIIGFVALTSASTLAFSGENCHSNRGMQAQGEYHKGMHGNKDSMSPEKRQAFMQLKLESKIERMTQRLDLTTQQQAEVREILKAKQQEMLQIHQSSRAQIDKILTDEQRQKMKK